MRIYFEYVNWNKEIHTFLILYSTFNKAWTFSKFSWITAVEEGEERRNGREREHEALMWKYELWSYLNETGVNRTTRQNLVQFAYEKNAADQGSLFKEL